MKLLSTLFLAFSLLAPSALCAPALQPLTITKYGGETTGKYIVQFKEGKASSRKSFINKHKLHGNITEWEGINGFAGTINPSVLSTLLHSEDVEFVEEDGISHAFTTVAQTNAPWGLQRISQFDSLEGSDPSGLDFTYTFDSSAGAGVDIYVVDTGIFTAHVDFGGRARWGATFGAGNADADGNGHGTHCTGTAIGNLFGVAKSANAIAVKVLNDTGHGLNSDIISGMNWVLGQARASGRPSVVSMSLGGGPSTAVDNAVASLTNAGIHVVVAAGNSNADASNTSPARAPSAITVGASTINDERSDFSNFGSVVNVFAPGSNIISAWIGNPRATAVLFGTSMATPHVAGLVAYLIGKEGYISPAAMANKIASLAVKGALSGIPSGTVNLLANND